MNFPFKKKSLLKKVLQKRSHFIKKSTFLSKNALNFLNIAQFLGVINDNVFKFLTVFLLIDLQGADHSSKILFAVGTVYVLPFLLFSSAAGVLADRFSKQKLIVLLKGIEVIITTLGVIAFSFASPWACYTLLFLLSFHSAVFGPPKYSIIPEIVRFEKISKANGLITSFTYLATIIGTFLASFTTQITKKNFALSASLCVVVAIVGFIASLFIPYTEPSRTKKRIKLFFLKEIYQTLIFCYNKPHLLTAILGAGFFLYVGAFFQLNVIPYAMQALGISEVGGGYLFLTVAIGIAGGAVLAGKLSKNRVELGLSCFAGYGLCIFLLFLAIFPSHLILALILLVFNGVCGGLFIVPFDSYIQTNSPDKNRGHIVATSNFMSFTGVLLAPFSLYLFSGIMKFSAANGFFIMSGLMLCVAFTILFKLSGIVLNFFGRRIFSKIYYTKFEKNPFDLRYKPLLIMPQSSMTKAMLLAGQSESIHFFILRNSPRILDFFYKMLSSVDTLYLSKLNMSVVDAIQSKVQEGKVPCLLLSKSLELEDADLHPKSIGSTPTLYIDVEKQEKDPMMHKHKQIVFKFSESPEN